MKLWFVQDRMHQAAAVGLGVNAETVKQSVDLNLERNRLMGEIDRCIDGDRPPRVKLT